MNNKNFCTCGSCHIYSSCFSLISRSDEGGQETLHAKTLLKTDRCELVMTSQEMQNDASGEREDILNCGYCWIAVCRR